MVAAVCCFKRFFKNKNPTPKNIVFYLNPPIMAKQEHLDVGTRNNLAPLFWAFAVSPLGQRGVSRGISGENTRDAHSRPVAARWRPNSSSPRNPVGTDRTWLSTNSSGHFSHDGWRALGQRANNLPFILPVTRALAVFSINRHFSPA